MAPWVRRAGVCASAGETGRQEGLQPEASLRFGLISHIPVRLRALVLWSVKTYLAGL